MPYRSSDWQLSFVIVIAAIRFHRFLLPHLYRDPIDAGAARRLLETKGYLRLSRSINQTTRRWFHLLRRVITGAPAKAKIISQRPAPAWLTAWVHTVAGVCLWRP
jgi:hypothetical protein